MVEFLEKLINLSISNAHKFTVVLIANVENLTKNYDNYEDNPVETEFLSYNEFNSMIQAIEKLGFETIAYTDELDFVRDFLDRKIKTSKEIFVINIAQKGTAVGRKSFIPSFCDLNHIKYAFSDAYVCSFARNKFHWYTFLRNNFHCLPQNWLFLKNNRWLFDTFPTSDIKLIAKLEGEAASIGLKKDNIFRYNRSKDLYLKGLAEKFNQNIVVQQFIEGYETEVPVIIDKHNAKALTPIGISMDSDFLLNSKILDYDSRFNHKYDFYNFEEHNASLSDAIRTTAEKIAIVMNLRGIVRIDFRIDKFDQYFVTDINAHPHLTQDMSVCFAMNLLGYKNYETVFAILIGTAIDN